MNLDAQEIARLQRNDEEAWARLQEEYFRRIYFYVKRYVSDHDTAEDLTQDVFLGALKGIGGFDSSYTLEQFLFGIAKNRVIDHFRKHKINLISPKPDDDSEQSAIWLENMPSVGERAPAQQALYDEGLRRKKDVLAKILREYVAELWSADEFQKLMILEYLFVLGGRNKNAAARFGISDEKAIAGIKFRAIEKLRGLARQNDPNHLLFLGLWQAGSR